jgi:hypothetical protein
MLAHDGVDIVQLPYIQDALGHTSRSSTGTTRAVFSATAARALYCGLDERYIAGNGHSLGEIESRVT